MTIRLHIERLVMDGPLLPPADRRRFLSAFESELERLLVSSPHSLTQGGSVPSLPPASTAVTVDDPARRGMAAANALFTSLTGGSR